jgi:hypothetical protein
VKSGPPWILKHDQPRASSELIGACLSSLASNPVRDAVVQSAIFEQQINSSDVYQDVMQSERLVLQKMIEDDAEALFDIFSDPIAMCWH